MKPNKFFSLLTAVTLALGGTAFAGATTYQVTGPIVEANDNMIVVMKGKERFEIDRDSTTKVNGDLKVGEKVTIMYTMERSAPCPRIFGFGWPFTWAFLLR